jgi:tubulin alpha
VRKLVEECSSLEGFVLTRSVGGNVGSGMGNLVLDLLSEYEKSAIVDFKLYPSVADATKEAALNSVLSTSLALSANTSMSLCVDKGSLHRICSKNLEIAKPAGTDIENLAGHLLSSITSPMRYSGSLNSSLNDMAKSLVPFPRLSQIIPSLTPILSEKKLSSIASDTKSLTNNVFMRDNHYFECVNRNDQENKYLAAYLSYQGTKFDLADLDTSIASLESKLSFAKFCPTRFKISLTPYSPTLIYNQNKMMVKNMNSVLGLINNTMIASTFNDYNQKLDEYIKSGATKKYMEKESTITESKEELGYLVEEYQTYSKDNPDLDDFMGDEFQMVDQA